MPEAISCFILMRNSFDQIPLNVNFHDYPGNLSKPYEALYITIEIKKR